MKKMKLQELLYTMPRGLRSLAPLGSYGIPSIDVMVVSYTKCVCSPHREIGLKRDR